MPIGLPSQRPEPKSACTLSSSPIERTMASELEATGRWSTRWLVVKSAGNSGQPASAAAVKATGSTQSAYEVGGVDEPAPQRLDQRLHLDRHGGGVDLLPGTGQDVPPAVQL